MRTRKSSRDKYLNTTTFSFPIILPGLKQYVDFVRQMFLELGCHIFSKHTCKAEVRGAENTSHQVCVLRRHHLLLWSILVAGILSAALLPPSGYNIFLLSQWFPKWGPRCARGPRLTTTPPLALRCLHPSMEHLSPELQTIFIFNLYLK